MVNDVDAGGFAESEGGVPAKEGYGRERPRPFAKPQAPKGPARFVPLLRQIRGYSLAAARPDVIAGVTIAALAVPQGMAYAQTAGLPVVAGLYGLLLPLLAYAVFGSSKVLMTGPTATAALMVPSALAVIDPTPAEYPVLAAMLALLVGAAFLLARALRLGWISDYFSSAVLLGFLTGLGLTLIAGQIGVLLGVNNSADTPLEQYGAFVKNLPGGWDAATVAIGVASLAMLLAGQRWFPGFPTLLVVTVLAIGVSSWADLGERGVVLVGDIPAGLPSLTWPSVGPVTVLELAPWAVGIALVAFADAILTARSLAATAGGSVDADQEMIALAGVNLAAGITGSMPLGSSGSRSAVNLRIGGRSQVVGLVQAVSVALVLLFLTVPLALLPKATLAAVIIFAAIGLIDVSGWTSLARGSKGELAIAGVTVLGMLTVGLLPALVLAVLLSVIDVVRRSAQPRDAVLGWSPSRGRFVDIQRRGDAVVTPGVVVYRLDDRLFFANSTYFRGRARDAVDGAPYEVHTFVFDAESVPQLDSSGAQALRQVVEDLGDGGVTFLLARGRTAFDNQLARYGLEEVIPPHHRFPTVRAAVAAAVQET